MPPRPAHPARPSRRGAVLVIMLVGLALLVALVFFTLNLGSQVNDRLSLQSASDAAVISGAGWVARSMNVLALNNVTQCRLLALAAMLDALPLAAEMTLHEQLGSDALPDALDGVGNGPAWTPYERDNFFRLGLGEIHRQQAVDDDTQLSLLVQINEAFASDDKRLLDPDDRYNVKRATHWSARIARSETLSDDQTGDFVIETGTWTPGPLGGLNGSSRQAVKLKSRATWIVTLPQADSYRVYARWPALTTPANTAATYRIQHADGETILTRNQNDYANQWVQLGRFTFNGVARVSIQPALWDEDDEDAEDLTLPPTVADGLLLIRDTGQPERGSIWQAAAAIDGFSRGTAVTIGELAQQSAVQFARANGATTALLVPTRPQLPIERGSFEDFEPTLAWHIRYGTSPNTSIPIRQVVQSDIVDRLDRSDDPASVARTLYVRGGAIPDVVFHTRMGPFATLFRWRDYWDHYSGNFESRRWVQSQRWGYTTFGPLDRAIRDVAGDFGITGSRWWPGSADLTRFTRHLRTLSQVKLAYLFGLNRPVKVQYADRWIANYPAAAALANRDRDAIMTTRYYEVTVKATVPWTSQHWMNPQSWQDGLASETFTPRRWFSWQLRGSGPYTDPSEQHLFRWAVDLPGWQPTTTGVNYTTGQQMGFAGHPSGELVYRDLTVNRSRQWTLRPQWIRIDPNGQVWYRRWSEQVVEDVELGLPQQPIGEQLDENGLPVCRPYTIYKVQWRIFGGAEVRDEFTLANPLAGADRDDLPAPYLLDPDQSEYNADAYDDGDSLPPYARGDRWETFCFLAATRRPSVGRVWPAKFHSGNPSGQITTLSQAIVYNNASWDLWTQNWRTRLTPVGRVQDWTLRLQDGLDSLPHTVTLDEAQLQELANTLESLDIELTDVFLNH